MRLTALLTIGIVPPPTYLPKKVDYMRFEAKKKSLASAVSQVKALTEALSVSTGNKIEAIHLSAGKKSLHLKSVSGAQIVDATVQDVTIDEPGEIAVDLKSLSRVLAVSGDSFKISKEGKGVNFSCGRTKGSIPVVTDAADLSMEADAPKPTIHVQGLKALLKAISLKVPNKNTERTLHFDPKKKTVMGETTDMYRGISASTAIGDDSQVPGHASLSLPSQVLDSIAQLLSTDAMVGFDEKFFTLKAPGLYVCLPQASTPPLQISSQMTTWLSTMDTFSTYTVVVGALREALDNATVQDGSDRLIMTFKGTTGSISSAGESSSVNSDFDLKDGGEGEVQILIYPSFIKECLAFFSTQDEVKLTVYHQAILLTRTSDEEGGVAWQSVVIPLLGPSEQLDEAVKKKMAKAAAAKAAAAKKPKEESSSEEDADEKADEPAPPAKKGKTAPPPPADEDDEDEAPPPPPPKKQAKAPPPPAEDDDQEATPEPPKKAPATTKKKAPPPPPEPEPDEEEEADEESFDDEE
jgi:DNA polymerase III sliding clamp (beta) subunit (PCNA family)